MERKTVRSLIRSLRQEERDARRIAAEVLGISALTLDLEQVLPALCEALQEKDDVVRACAAWAIGMIGPEGVEAALPLIRALTDQSALVRRQAAWALRKIGPAAVEAIPALTNALQDEDEGVRANAAWALGRIKKEKAP